MREPQAETGLQTNPTGRTRRPTVVVDTSILLGAPQPYQLEELKTLGPAHYVIPATVVSELDLLKARPTTRDKARAALNVLKGFVQRGAASKPVSCGAGGSTLRIASREDEVPQPWLHMELNDDRILAVCLHLAANGKDVKLATVEFPLFLKAATAGVDGIYLERCAESSTVVTRRERESFRSAWQRLQASDSPSHACRRAISFLKSPLAKRIADQVRRTQEPREVFSIISRFDHLAHAWTTETDLSSVLKDTLGLDPPPYVDYSAEQLVNQPAVFGFGPTYQYATTRRETPEERVLRIRSAENWQKALEDRIVDIVLSWLEVVREYILDQVGDDVG